MKQPLFNSDGAAGGGTPATFEINGQQMTAEQLADSYKKLQGEYTKVTQKNSEYSKNEEKVKAWLEFDTNLDKLSEQTGVNVKALAGAQLDGLLSSLAQGKAPTAAQVQKLETAIDKAEAKGDDKTVQQLESLQSIVMQNEFEKTVDGIEKLAKSDEIAFDRKEFLDFADEWLDDMGIGDDDEFDLKLLNKAYQAYEAKKLKEQVKQPKIPALGTSGGTGAPNKGDGKPEKVGGLRGAAAKAMQYINS